MNSLSQTGPQIDTTTPSITAIAESPATGDLGLGKTVSFTVDLSDAVTVSGGAPTLTLNDGGTATYVSGSGTDALVFAYTVTAANSNVASLAATAANLNGATIVNGAGTKAVLSMNGLSQTGPAVWNGYWFSGGALVASAETIYVEAGITASITGAQDNVTIVGAGTTLTIGGNGAGGNVNVVNANKDALTLNSNSNTTLNGNYDAVTEMSNANLRVNGYHDVVAIGNGNDAIWLGGAIDSTIDIGSLGGGVLTIQGFSTGNGNVIDLLNGVRGLRSAAAASHDLISDGEGGAYLSLGSSGKIDFIGVKPSALTAASFKIG